jgi:tetratricopeptide (TPR) repeat protein
LAPASLWADVKKLQIDKNSPEGQYMDLVALESDSARKVALLEHFLTLFPKSDPGVTAWIYIELQDRYRRAGALDKALAAGERVLAIDPDNIEVSRANWRIAETKKDEELIKKWSTETGKIAERLVKAPLPADPEAMKAAQDVMAYARQFVVNSDYQDFNKAVKTADPAQRLAALEDFVRKSPQNPYMDQIEIAQFLAYKEIGDVDKTVAAAERILARDANRDDAMLFIAEVNFRRKKDPKRTLELANKFIEHMAVATRPEAQSEADWSRSKNRNLMLAHYMIGTVHFQAGQWSAADRSLRVALSFVGDDQLKSTLLYNLGWANYQMQSAVEAIKFYRLCAAIPGPLQDQAGKNVLSIKSEYNLP